MAPRRHTRGRHTKGKHSKGLSLIEMLITMAIAAILIIAVVPNLGTLINNNQLSANNNALTDGILLARSEALKRSQTVSICSSSDGASCSGDTDWSGGWLVWSDTNGDMTLDVGEEILQVSDAMNVQATASNAEGVAVLQFLPQGFANIAAGASRNFQLCDQRTAETGWLINIQSSGKISNSRLSCS